ncbi:MAG: UDP-glucose--hexose-1-phosphate uridylyltransferase [Lachnospiraceae bacterium]|nr:UDP-glucose--hexose-1-phosphate uridylyltransferase [Lachnospiraceae bacterium]
MNINNLITELVNYGIDKGLVDKADVIYVTNRLLELFQLNSYKKEDVPAYREVHLILKDMLDYAVEKGFLEDTITNRDLFDTKIMGILTPAPSVIRSEFKKHYDISPQDATKYYYDFSRATNYIRNDRIIKDEKWTSDTEFGLMDITINLSKPEKDPRDIAKAAKGINTEKSDYPACLLCHENEGYAGHFSHPARQNHRIIPITLAGESYYLQYSPYVYYNEHCIIFNEKHTPMKIDRAAFAKLLDFVRQFPHYTAGSNADLPIVGGSILTHDHFQGGGYEFAMVRAPYETELKLKDYPDVHAGIIKWPLSTIRLQAKNIDDLVNASDRILSLWRSYTDEEAFILAETDGTPHNTITPIARMRGNLYEIDLVLRNNITTEEFPLGVYHPHQKYHHIKRENIGLIEVMGLAVLPARLKKEMAALEDAILAGKDLRADEQTAPHADWAEEWIKKYNNLTADNIHKIVQDEIADVFSHVLEDAGVYKRTDEGRTAFKRFTDLFAE